MTSGDSASMVTGDIPDADAPRKRRKLADDDVPLVELERQLSGWISVEHEISTFNLQHVKSTSRLVFSFVEGPLVQALRSGEWYVEASRCLLVRQLTYLPLVGSC
jgi:midasin (ATPase involved in ribosome maturation)